LEAAQASLTDFRHRFPKVIAVLGPVL
jgi:hypothetical protein